MPTRVAWLVNAGEVNRSVLVEPQPQPVFDLRAGADRQHVAAFTRVDPGLDAAAINAQQLEHFAASHGCVSVRRLALAVVIETEAEYMRRTKNYAVECTVFQIGVGRCSRTAKVDRARIDERRSYDLSRFEEETLKLAGARINGGDRAGSRRAENCATGNRWNVQRIAGGGFTSRNGLWSSALRVWRRSTRRARLCR